MDQKQTKPLDDRCFACDRKLGRHPRIVDTRDAQTVRVGSECYSNILAAGGAGWQPPKGGPRLYLLIHCEKCGSECEADHNSYQCHGCGMLWPLTTG